MKLACEFDEQQTDHDPIRTLPLAPAGLFDCGNAQAATC